jgi:hypothetical protein
MGNDVTKQPEQQLTPYGRWPDGTPITQIEALAKQMNDWANRHGFSGSVRMGSGTQFDEPKRWHEVTINQGKTLPAAPMPPSLPVPEVVTEIQELPAPVPAPQPQSWFRRLLNLFKGDS